MFSGALPSLTFHLTAWTRLFGVPALALAVVRPLLGLVRIVDAHPVLRAPVRQVGIADGRPDRRLAAVGSLPFGRALSLRLRTLRLRTLRLRTLRLRPLRE